MRKRQAETNACAVCGADTDYALCLACALPFFAQRDTTNKQSAEGKTFAQKHPRTVRDGLREKRTAGKDHDRA